MFPSIIYTHKHTHISWNGSTYLPNVCPDIFQLFQCTKCLTIFLQETSFQRFPVSPGPGTLQHTTPPSPQAQASHHFSPCRVYSCSRFLNPFSWLITSFDDIFIENLVGLCLLKAETLDTFLLLLHRFFFFKANSLASCFALLQKLANILRLAVLIHTSLQFLYSSSLWTPNSLPFFLPPAVASA